MAEDKLIKVQALVFKTTLNDGETQTHWGVSFTKEKAGLFAELPKAEAEAMIEAGRAK
ncbi:MAG: hypothetical protein IMF04_00955 [Proteobacteria bacterium]|nr:hypothetical protein [Pseudomonadota bacterium]